MFRTSSLRLLFALSLLFAFFYLAPIVQSCADPGDPFGDFSTHPDVPLEKFAAGSLGILRPSFARSYLVVAYRYASGVPLTRDEQNAAFALWNSRVQNLPAYDSPTARNPYMTRPDIDAPTTWAGARGQVVSTPPPQIDQMQGGDDYSQYLNCADDSLNTAASTLADRVKTFGKEHPGIQAWVAAQDLVFANCGGTPDKPAIPQPPDASLPEILRFDRQYQIAAAYMYSDHFNEADKRLQQIAAEKNSPWCQIAPYLVARNMVRRASLPSGGDDPDTVREKAGSYMRSLLADSPDGKYARQLQALLNRVEFRNHPGQQTAYLSGLLRKPVPDGLFYQTLWDYTLLLDNRPDVRSESVYSANEAVFTQNTPERQSDELTDWIATFQLDGGATHALEMWHAHPSSLPWLLAILSKTQKDSAFVSEVLTAAGNVPVNSPAYVSVFYHRMRVLNAQRNFGEVRKSIDALLASPGDLPSVAKQDLLDLRLDAAADLDDALPRLPRNPCEIQHAQSNCTPVPGLHVAKVLSDYPLDVLVSIALNPKLPVEFRSLIGRNIWMRAVLLHRHDAAQSLDSFMRNPTAFPGNPPTDAVDQWIKQYESAQTAEEKEFAAVFILQHEFAVGFDIGSNDAWCASPYAFEDRYTQKKTAPAALPDISFFTEAQRQESLAERNALNLLDSQANYYAKTVIDFAEKHPDDPRVPEALSRAVKNTRRNCNNDRTTLLSKRAFDLLHQRYGNTDWAKNTKYWYGENVY
jgi:hypothetical protein